METFVIAEAGANHNRDIKNAFALIDAAKNAGATAVKFQTYSSETLYCKNTKDFAGYKNINKLIKDIELPRSWQKELKMYCDDTGIEFMSTPFDEAAVDELVSLGVKRLKIAGFESTDPRFVKMVASTGLPLIISAGIGNNINSISRIIFWVHEVQSNPDITILHCNNAYPTPNEDICLKTVRRIKNNFPFIRVGLSDHTEEILTPAFAIHQGATCIEKHFTLSKKMIGPDHPFALEPDQLKEMIDMIKLAETMNRENKKVITASEAPFENAMRSVVSSRTIEEGETITLENITTMRPKTKNSIPAEDFYRTIGKKAIKKIEANTVLNRGDVNV